MSRPSTYRRPSNLSIRPPSPSRPTPSPLSTPTHQMSSVGPLPPGGSGALYSPRRAPLPPSPTYSATSFASTGTKGSSGLGMDLPPPVPRKDDGTRLPLPPPVPGVGGGGAPGSPYRGGKGGWAVGPYDNKLVSSTLSHLPPLPPLPHSPTPTSTTHSIHPVGSSSHLHPSTSLSATTSPRPSLANPSPLPAPTAVVVFPDGTPLADHAHSHGGSGHEPPVGRVAETMTMAHSSPSSPWSLLTVHVLPLFAGSALKTPIEDLNHLCHSHIVATSQRTAPARIVALLTGDLREFIASGMLTLKAKFETLEEGKVVSRAAEVWSFFWAQVLPYVEGVFLPFTQLRDMATKASSASTTTATASSTSAYSPIPVRHYLLSGFLLHILLPLLPRLIPQIRPQSSFLPSPSPSINPPSPQDLSRILQMSLVLSTQAKYSSFFTSPVSADRDEEVRYSVEGLGQAVRYRTQQTELEQAAAAASTSRPGSPGGTPGVGAGGAAVRTASPGVPGISPRTSLALQRKPSLSQSGRYRRRGWRASSYMGQLGPGPGGFHLGPGGPGGAGGDSPSTMSRQDSGGEGLGEFGRWDRGGGVDEEDEREYEEGDDFTPNGNGQGQVYGGAGQVYGPPGQAQRPTRLRDDTADSASSLSLNITSSMMSGGTNGPSTAGSTLTAGTVRGESLASYGETPTPSAIVLGGAVGGGNAAGVGAGVAGVGSGARSGDMMYGRPTMRNRTESSGSSELAPPVDTRWERRV
ncbi:hypothetical protein IAT38_001684 [Cryptococcus sp. DSM 104549]